MIHGWNSTNKVVGSYSLKRKAGKVKCKQSKVGLTFWRPQFFENKNNNNCSSRSSFQIDEGHEVSNGVKRVKKPLKNTNLETDGCSVEGVETRRHKYEHNSKCRHGNVHCAR